jgi:hypothetical protein
MEKFDDWNDRFESLVTKMSFVWKFDDEIDYSICLSVPPLIFSPVPPLTNRHL